MPDEIVVKPIAESTSTITLPVVESPTITLQRSLLINIFAAILGLSFFLTWAQIFGKNLSGFDLQKVGKGYYYLHWIIPICAALTIGASFSGFSQKIIAQVTGALPFLFLLFWLNRVGSDLLQVLSFGASLSLLSGLALFILPHLKK